MCSHLGPYPKDRPYQRIVTCKTATKSLQDAKVAVIEGVLCRKADGALNWTSDAGDVLTVWNSYGMPKMPRRLRK